MEMFDQVPTIIKYLKCACEQALPAIPELPNKILMNTYLN